MSDLFGGKLPPPSKKKSQPAAAAQSKLNLPKPSDSIVMSEFKKKEPEVKKVIEKKERINRVSDDQLPPFSEEERLKRFPNSKPMSWKELRKKDKGQLAKQFKQDMLKGVKLEDQKELVLFYLTKGASKQSMRFAIYDLINDYNFILT